MWHINSEVLVTDLEGELVLMHPGSSEMFSLNASGRLIWQALPAGEEGLVRLLAAHYGLAPDQAAEDVRIILEALQSRHLAEFH